MVAGGLVAGDQSTASSFRIALDTGRVRRLPDLAVPVHDLGGASLHGEPTIFGGGNATEQDVVQRRTPSGGWQVVGQLPSPRSDLSATAVRGRVLVVGGYDGQSPALSDILATSDGRTFDVVGRLTVPVRYAAVAVAAGGLWVFGGERNGVMVDAVQRIDLATGRTRVVGRLPGPLGEASAVTMHGQVLLAGGRTSPTSLTRSVWWFDPTTRRFHPAGRLPMPLADSVAVTTGGAAYLLGGETPGLTDRVLTLTPRG